MNMKDLILTFVFFLVLVAGYSQTMQQPKSTKIQVYPNPTTNFFKIKEGQEVATIHLYNLIGKRVRTFYPAQSVDFYVEDLNSGMYLVQMLNTEGKVLTTNRLTKR